MSITSAQRQALRDQFIQKLGFKPLATGDEIGLPILEETLALYGQAFNDAIVSNLRKSNSISSGALAQPAIPVVLKFGNKYVLEVGYKLDSEQVKYFEYVDEGVLGTKNEKANPNTRFKYKKSKKSVPIDNIKLWIEQNSLKSVSVKKYTKLGTEQKAITNSRSLAFIIARSIHKKGLRTTNYFTNAVTQVFENEKFRNDVSAALGDDFELKIIRIKNGNNNNK